jgi:hypothetical protein
MPVETPSPWRFLAALDGARELDRKILQATRCRELNLVNHMIMAAKVCILYAASGNGKTSLLNAGVIPHFLELGYAVFRTRPRPPWCVNDPITAFEECMIREQWLPAAPSDLLSYLESAKAEMQKFLPAHSPITRQLLTQFEAQYYRLSQAPEARSADLMALLRARRGSRSLVSILQSVQSFLGADTRILLICDQFEELFVHYSGTSQLQEFVDQTGEVCKAANIKAQFLFSMREDWVGSMIEFRPVIPDIFSFYYKLHPLLEEQAKLALTMPLAGTGYTMENVVAERILGDLSAAFPSSDDFSTLSAHRSRENRTASYIELPALQIVAEALWKTRDMVEHSFSASHYNFLRAGSLGSQNASGKRVDS